MAHKYPHIDKSGVCLCDCDKCRRPVNPTKRFDTGCICLLCEDCRSIEYVKAQATLQPLSGNNSQ